MKQKRLTASQFETIVDTMAEGLFVLDENSRVVLWNSKMEKLTGRKSADVVGKYCSEVGKLCGTPEDRKHCALFLSGNVAGDECAIKNKNGEIIPVIRNSRIIFDSKGERAGAVATIADLRPLLETQKELELTRARLEHTVSKLQVEELLIGKSHQMRTLSSLIVKASATDVTVLIEGETGTGKELVAKSIHQQSPRRDKAFISVNCSALSAGLLESELFGHIRGAFTGAIENRLGRFEAAEGGTIFLDEVAELELSVQAKLLRVLQERTIERLGESRSRSVDVRVVAATNKALDEMVREGLFREDLYYRLKVFPLQTHPLRERKIDIPILANHFLKEEAKKRKKRKSKLSEAALHALTAHCWPGNVRELENAIMHGVIMAGQQTIDIGDLPREVVEACRNRNLVRKQQVSRMTTAELQELLLKARGNLSEVARQLGVHRSTIMRRAKKLGVDY